MFDDSIPWNLHILDGHIPLKKPQAVPEKWPMQVVSLLYEPGDDEVYGEPL